MVQMLVDFPPHHPYDKRAAHQKRNAQGIEEYDFASSAPVMKLVFERMRHMPYRVSLPISFAPELSAVFVRIEPHYIFFKPSEESRRPFRK